MLPRSLRAAVGGHGSYEGSRLVKVRYKYEKDSWAGFIEMSREWSEGPSIHVIRKFRQALLAVPDTTAVRLHPKGNKTVQNNIGNHYQDHNFVVTTKRTGSTYIEFELTRNGHTKHPTQNFTVTAMFKGPALELVPEAWRILRTACLSNSLLPAVAEWNHRVAVDKLQNEQQPGHRGPAGSSRFDRDHRDPAGSSKDTGFAMSDARGAAPASPTGLEPSEKRTKSEHRMPVAQAPERVPPPPAEDESAPPSAEDEFVPPPPDDEFEADWDEELPPQEEIEPMQLDESKINLDEFQQVLNVDDADFLANAAGPVFDNPAQRLGLDMATAAELFPQYLRPAHLETHLGVSQAMDEMQELKRRGLEHVRYRHVDISGANAQILGGLQQIRRSLQIAIGKVDDGNKLLDLSSLLKETPAGFATGELAQDFLKRGGKKSLWVTHLKGNDVEGDRLRQKYCWLVRYMPQCVIEKMGDDMAFQKRFEVLTNLTRKHSGELVAADKTRDYWRLVAVAPGFATVDWGEQFWCFEDGQPIPDLWDVETRQEAYKQWWPFVPGQANVLEFLMEEDQRAVRRVFLHADALKPAWDQMRFRHVCPCVDTDKYAWVRQGKVVSIGELFMLLGQEYTAAEIYAFYRCMRIVCLKRRKNRSGGHSALGSAVAGVAAGRVRRGLGDWRELLIEEYATLKGQPLPAREEKRYSRELFKAAVQYIHVNLLQDLSPPWIEHDFPMALPGDGILARYLKPTFLRWPLEVVGALFGEKVLKAWAARCHRVGLELGAVLGRPLYFCTRKLPSGAVCGAIAAMSPLMEQREKHKEFMCKDCAERSHPGAHQALPVLRLVRLYAQVSVDKDRCLAMRSASMYILVHAPRNDTVWGVGHQAPDYVLAAGSASPGNLEMYGRLAFSYSDGESHNIWLYSSHFQEATYGGVL